MDKSDIVMYTILTIFLLFIAGLFGWAIANNQMQNEAIMTRNAHWETLPNGHTIFKWNNI